MDEIIFSKPKQGNPSFCEIEGYISKEKANVTNKKPDITKAVNELGHNPSTMLDEGLPKTIDWMKKIYLEG